MSDNNLAVLLRELHAALEILDSGRIKQARDQIEAAIRKALLP
jgi:hypothetical protein